MSMARSKSPNAPLEAFLRWTTTQYITPIQQKRQKKNATMLEIVI